MEISPPPGAGAGLRESLGETLRAIRGYLAELLELAVVEARLSITVLTVVGILAAAIVLLAVTAWLVLVAAAVVLAVRAGMDWPGALLGAAALNALACVPLVIYVRCLIRGLGFSATRESVALQAPQDLRA
ncbi:MAG: hypothetical protein ACLGHR_09580 [Gammaproteobacteria bacterium]